MHVKQTVHITITRCCKPWQTSVSRVCVGCGKRVYISVPTSFAGGETGMFPPNNPMPRIRILCTHTAARDSRTTSCNSNICSWRGACSGHGAPQANCQRLSLLSSVQRRLSRTLAPRASLVHQCTRSELARMHHTDGNTTSQRNNGALQHTLRIAARKTTRTHLFYWRDKRRPSRSWWRS
jgi:hypothetical protein